MLFYYMFFLYFSSAAFVTYQSYCYRINNTKIKSLLRRLRCPQLANATAFTGQAASDVPTTASVYNDSIEGTDVLGVRMMQTVKELQTKAKTVKE